MRSNLARHIFGLVTKSNLKFQFRLKPYQYNFSTTNKSTEINEEDYYEPKIPLQDLNEIKKLGILVQENFSQGRYEEALNYTM